MERSAHFAAILASLVELDYVVEWRLLNATHFGLPQNRQRVVMIGTIIDDDTNGVGLSNGELPSRLATPEDVSSLNPNELD